MNGLPLTMNKYVSLVVRETARLSYPGGMGRGENHVLIAGAKAAVEQWFVAHFPVVAVWDNAQAIAEDCAAWHEQRTARMVGDVLQPYIGNPSNLPQTIAAKLLDTFMHQLMKYEQCRPLWAQLHLPLDRRIFGALRHRGAQALDAVADLFQRSPYAITYPEYQKVQDALWGFIQELNDRPGAEVQFHSRLELNWLWL